MTYKGKDHSRRSGYGRKLAEEFCALSRRILRAANLGVPRNEFLKMIMEEFLNFSKCDEVEMRINEGIRYYRGVLNRSSPDNFLFTIATRNDCDLVENFPGEDNESVEFNEFLRDLTQGRYDTRLPYFTTNGALLIPDMSEPMKINGKLIRVPGQYRSAAVLTFPVSEDRHGIIFLKSLECGYFQAYEVEFYQGVAQTLGVALADRRAQAALRERIKELTCLYELDRIFSKDEVELDEIFQAVVEKLPPAWLYSDIASACIKLDGKVYATQGYVEGLHSQMAKIRVHNRERGFVKVTYRETRPVLDEGPFLKEERNLIEAVAREIGIFIERREAKQEKARLEHQLRHADRLATIGQLAAGVAHELNEPLANILGFAQLVLKLPEIPKQAVKDIERIVRAALHAREVINKLMLFARVRPPQQVAVNLNSLVTDGLYFLRSRCAKAGIEVSLDLAQDLPEIAADPTQMHQVLVNLVVNAIQAMPSGGKLKIATVRKDAVISLIVEDTGAGMTEEVKAQIFVPFFTTKPVGEGTGLGLSVAHGIVSAHGGTINVESEPGKGSRFEVVLPIRPLGNR
uniref:histidine kinase n=1 Tax=candidate division WOR-3 bacterium TaxID=2052148 RepID=A0A7V3PTZ4_UNCW3